MVLKCDMDSPYQDTAWAESRVQCWLAKTSNGAYAGLVRPGECDASSHPYVIWDAPILETEGRLSLSLHSQLAMSPTVLTAIHSAQLCKCHCAQAISCSLPCQALANGTIRKVYQVPLSLRAPRNSQQKILQLLASCCTCCSLLTSLLLCRCPIKRQQVCSQRVMLLVLLQS